MQRWEYLTKTRVRSGAKNTKWSDNPEWLNELGKDGWELVSGHTRSDSRTWSGFSTDEVWVFKRPLA